MGTALEKEVNKSLEKTLVCLLRYKKKSSGFDLMSITRQLCIFAASHRKLFQIVGT